MTREKVQGLFTKSLLVEGTRRSISDVRLSSFRVRNGEVLLPPGKYDFSSDIGVSEAIRGIEVHQSTEELRVAIPCRRDVALVSMTASEKQGRNVAAMAMIAGNGVRRGLILKSNRPSLLALAPGEYKVTAVTGYESTKSMIVSVRESDCGRQKDLVMILDLDDA